MGWGVSSNGFGLVMSRDVPHMADAYLGDEVNSFLADYGLTTDDISTWICHPGGPKVLDAIERAVGLPPEANVHSRESMRENGNFCRRRYSTCCTARWRHRRPTGPSA